MSQMTSGPPVMRNTESLPQREPRRDRGERRDRGGGGGGGGRRLVDSSDSRDDRGRSSRFPDSHQLFVGNLPQDINDDELKNFFSRKLSHRCAFA